MLHATNVQSHGRGQHRLLVVLLLALALLRRRRRRLCAVPMCGRHLACATVIWQARMLAPPAAAGHGQSESENQRRARCERESDGLPSRQVRQTDSEDPGSAQRHGDGQLNASRRAGGRDRYGKMAAEKESLDRAIVSSLTSGWSCCSPVGLAAAATSAARIAPIVAVLAPDEPPQPLQSCSAASPNSMMHSSHGSEISSKQGAQARAP
jgi:hypothetical protein